METRERSLVVSFEPGVSYFVNYTYRLLQVGVHLASTEIIVPPMGNIVNGPKLYVPESVSEGSYVVLDMRIEYCRLTQCYS